MKRPVLHILFWLVYLIQDSLLYFTWMIPFQKDVPVNRQVFFAIATAIAVLPPKLFIVYYLTRLGIKKLMDEGRKRVWTIAEILFVFAAALILFRIIFYFVSLPMIYGLHAKELFFDARNILIAVLEIGYVAGIAIAFKLLRMQTVMKEREKSLVKEKLETELKFLRNQANPHFLFNTLNNIYALARKKSDKTPEVVMKLSELLSFMLYESGKDTISIAEEIKMMDDYLDLERIRYSNRLSVQFRKNIDNDAQPIAPLLLLPLVENAFKHGVSETRFDSFINIEILLKNGQLHFFIENTIENDKPRLSVNSIGLKNMKRQLELMYREYDLKVKHEGQKFAVNININLNSYGKI